MESYSLQFASFFNVWVVTIFFNIWEDHWTQLVIFLWKVNIFSFWIVICFNNKVQMLRVGYFQAEFANKSQAESNLFL